MKFFFDRCMSIRLCRMVAILETGRQHLTHHDEDPRFTPNTTDVEWIEVLSRDAERPIVVSGDCKILKRPDEVVALQKSSLTYFCLADHWSDFPIYDMVWKFLKVWPEIAKAAAVSEPTVFQVCGGQIAQGRTLCADEEREALMAPVCPNWTVSTYSTEPKRLRHPAK